jgi:hypothetical protein
LIKIMLEKLGYTVLPASPSGQAMRQASAHPGEIHLLITAIGKRSPHLSAEGYI